MTRSSELTVYLPYPPTANNLFPSGKGGKRFISPEYKAWKTLAGLALNPQIAGKPLPLNPPYALAYEISRPDNRRRDLANTEKALTDLLVASGVITDDCKIDALILRWVRDVPWEVRATIRTIP